MDPAAVQPEVAVLNEKGLGRGVVLVARHDEPVELPPVPHARRDDLLREDLEEGAVAHGRDGKRSLGPVVAEARSLPSRHRERGDPPVAQRSLSRRPRLRPCRRIAPVFRQAFIGCGRQSPPGPPPRRCPIRRGFAQAGRSPRDQSRPPPQEGAPGRRAAGCRGRRTLAAGPALRNVSIQRCVGHPIDSRPRHSSKR